MSSFPQFPRSDKFNPALFASDTDTFTLASADLRYVRIGSDAFLSNVSCSSLTINGTLADLTPIIGVTSGIAAANKALVLDGTRNISNINNITSTGLISNSFINNTGNLNALQQWSNNLATPITCELDISNIGASIGTLTNHPFRLLANGQNRLWVDPTGLIGINNNSPSYQLDVSGTTMATALKIRQTGSGTTDVPNFTIDTSSAAGYSGLRIAPDATNLLNLSCLGFWNAGYSTLTMYVANNGNQNCVHMRPSNAADVSSPIPNVGLCVGNNAIIRNGLIVSSMPMSNSNNYTPQCKLRVIGDNNYLDGSYQKVAEFCNSTYGNTLTIQCSSTAGGPVFFGTTTASDIRFGTSNSTSMILTTTDHLLIGTTTDAAPLTVNGTSTYTVVPFATNTYRFPISTGGASTNLGGGPVSFSISAYFSSNILVNGGSVYTTSDRRLKRDIKPIDFDLDHYQKFEPVSYTYKNESQPRLGLIAQDVMKVCSEMVGFSENENLKKETDDDPEDGIQYTVDYNQLSVMNTVAVKKLIDRVRDLELIVDKLTSKPALTKWLSKN